MVKRKDQNDPSVTTTPSVKKPRVSAAATALTAAATCSPSMFQRILGLLGRQGRKQSNTVGLSEQFVTPLTMDLLRQPLSTLRNGLLVPHVLRGSLNLQRRGTPLSQVNWWDREGE